MHSALSLQYITRVRLTLLSHTMRCLFHDSQRLLAGGMPNDMTCFQASAPHPTMPVGVRASASGRFASSPRAPSMGHFGINRAPERSAAAAQGFNAFPGAAPRPLGQGFGPLGPASHVAFSPGDLTSANGLYDSSHGVGQHPAALPASPAGYGSAYSPSDPCEPYMHSPSFLCTDACFLTCICVQSGTSRFDKCPGMYCSWSC